jgi:hypothetical protein
MAVRSTMTALITRTRRLTGDTGTAVFDDQAYQDALDRYRQEARLLPLRAQERISSGGAVTFLEFFAPMGDWESAATVQTQNFVTLTETTDYTADYLAGIWSMVASQWPPLFLSGQTYDVQRAAAEILRSWAAKVALSYDYSQNGQQFIRSQQRHALQEMAAECERRGRVLPAQTRRSDQHRSSY